MYGMALITNFLMVYLYVLTMFANAGATAAVNIRDRDAGQHLAIYGNVVKSYAAANPGYTGAVSDTSLGLPAWFKRTASEGCYVVAGTAYVYASPPDRAAGLAMARAAGGSGSGYKENGNLTVPGIGPTTTSIPAAVPNGMAVIVQ